MNVTEYDVRVRAERMRAAMKIIPVVTRGWFVPPACPCGTACGDEGVRAFRDLQDAEERARRRGEWLARSGIPAALREATLLGCTPTVAIRAVSSYIGVPCAEGKCLVLAGPTGVGKSYAAAAALLSLSLGRMWYFPALCAALLNPERRRDAMQSVTEANGLIVLDDLGVEYVKHGGLIEPTLDEIIWNREGNRRPTIITTNLTTDDLRARLSDRIVDRLRGEWGQIVECPGDSLR